MVDEADNPYVSRGGLKLAAALAEFRGFGVDVGGYTCVDLGCNVGGFTDCLLQMGAAKVYAVDTGYGALAWKLRQDERVVVMERTNAMHGALPGELRGLGIAAPPEGGEHAKPQAARTDLAVIDMGWTVQRHALAAALRWGPRRIVTLVKPHYEMSASGDGGAGGDASGKGDRRRRRTPVLEDDEAERVAARVIGQMGAWGVRVLGSMRSPIRGGAGKGRAGNLEWLALVEPDDLR